MLARLVQLHGLWSFLDAALQDSNPTCTLGLGSSCVCRRRLPRASAKAQAGGRRAQLGAALHSLLRLLHQGVLHAANELQEQMGGTMCDMGATSQGTQVLRRQVRGAGGKAVRRRSLPLTSTRTCTLVVAASTAARPPSCMASKRQHGSGWVASSAALRSRRTGGGGAAAAGCAPAHCRRTPRSPAPRSGPQRGPGGASSTPPHRPTPKPALRGPPGPERLPACLAD